MAKMKTASRANPCGVCGGTDSRCRTSDDGLMLCMTYQDKVPGLGFRGTCGDGLWGMYVEGGEQYDAQAAHERKQRRLERERKQRAAALPAEERDRLHQTLLAQLTLDECDRTDLARRGMSAAEIRAAGFKSVGWRDPLPDRALVEMPGVLPGYRLNSVLGYLCSARDVHGRILGFQVRARRSGAKYIWLSAAEHGGTGPQTQDGEMPLSVCRPASRQDAPGVTKVALVEGVGPKPVIVANRFDCVAIGAAGGLWASSPKMLADTLDALGCQEVEFFPDAGSILNWHVSGSYRSAFDLLRQLGVRVRVRWWGQEDKWTPDPDEVDPGDTNLIDLSTFARIAKGRAVADCTALARSLGIRSPDPRQGVVELLKAKTSLEAERDLRRARDRLVDLAWSLGEPVPECTTLAQIESAIAELSAPW